MKTLLAGSRDEAKETVMLHFSDLNINLLQLCAAYRDIGGYAYGR